MSLLYEKLSYEVRGCAIEVRKNYGPGHKEGVYQNAFAEELVYRNIPFKKEESIRIYSPKSGRVMGTYRPDFIIDSKIVVELKAVTMIPKNMVDRLFDYLRNSIYELGFLINFGGDKLYIKRAIYTNDRKPWFKRVQIETESV